MGGCLNTLFTYGVYIGLNPSIGYNLAYAIAYVIGIIFSYGFNALVVFKAPLSWKGLFAYPVVYLLQYGISALGLRSLVESFGISQTFAPLFLLVVTVPLTYFASRWVIKMTNRRILR